MGPPGRESLKIPSLRGRGPRDVTGESGSSHGVGVRAPRAPRPSQQVLTWARGGPSRKPPPSFLRATGGRINL